MNNFLKERNLFILDGGMGTELEKIGFVDDRGLWSSEALMKHPESVYNIHYKYFEAGSDIAITNTYETNQKSLNLVDNNLDSKKLTKIAVDLAKSARDKYSEISAKKLYIAGSLGSYSTSLKEATEYTGDYNATQEEFKNFYRPMIKNLISEDVDILAFETQSNSEEIKAIKNLLNDEFPEALAWISLSVDQKGSYQLVDKTSLRQVCDLLNDIEQIIALGVNCLNIDLVDEYIKKLKLITNKDIVVYPNNGDVYDSGVHDWV